MDPGERKIVLLKLSGGRIPFKIWFDTLSTSFQRIVDVRITRIRDGNFGDHKLVGKGVFELRIHSGGGLKIYYAVTEKMTITLLTGGTKSTQKRDIQQAQRMWRDYQIETR